jgi:hypothetical protein
MNYNGKIIGLYVGETVGSRLFDFVPCSPSSQLDGVELIFMDNIEWTNYESTIQESINLIKYFKTNKIL